MGVEASRRRLPDHFFLDKLFFRSPSLYMDVIFLQARILATQNLIIVLETALLTLSSGSTQSFTLDTGQTRQSVTKKDTPSIQASLDSAYNLLATLEARLYGSAGQARPGW